jgi:hypothetical protein
MKQINVGYKNESVKMLSSVINCTQIIQIGIHMVFNKDIKIKKQ